MTRVRGKASALLLNALSSCLQDESIVSLPRLIQKQDALLSKAEQKFKALKALQPEWVQLKSLQETGIKTTEAKLRALDIEMAGKASATADLHDQKVGMEAELQVLFFFNLLARLKGQSSGLMKFRSQQEG